MRPDSNYLDAQPPKNLDVARRHPRIASRVALVRPKLNIHASSKEWLPAGHFEPGRDSNYLDTSQNGQEVALGGVSIATPPRNLRFDVAP